MWQIYEMKVVVLTCGGLVFGKYLESKRNKKCEANTKRKYKKVSHFQNFVKPKIKTINLTQKSFVFLRRKSIKENVI